MSLPDFSHQQYDSLEVQEVNLDHAVVQEEKLAVGFVEFFVRRFDFSVQKLTRVTVQFLLGE